MRAFLGLYIDSALLLLNFISYASSVPRGDTYSSTDKSQGSAILPHHPSSRGSYRTHHVSIKPTDALIKRDDDDDLRVRWINIVSGSVPIAAAAHSLQMFYNAILFNTLTQWCTQPPQQVMVMTMGRLQLTMKIVVGSGVRQGIPWAFVRNFARNMLAMTAMGFTGTYDMVYLRVNDLFPSAPADIGVEVRLRFLWNI